MKKTERRTQLIEIMDGLHQKAQNQADFTAAKIAEAAGISIVWFYKLVRPEFQALRSQLSGPRLSRDEELCQLRNKVTDLSHQLQKARDKLRTTAVEDLDEAILLLERYEKENNQLRQQNRLLQKRLEEGGEVIVTPTSRTGPRPNLPVVNNDKRVFPNYEKDAMTIKIDPITTSDVPIIEQLTYEYNRELDPGEIRQEAVNHWITSIVEATAAGQHFFWLARVEEQIIGFVSFRLSTNPFTQETSGFIEGLYIVPSFRRRGYAEELIRAAFATTIRQGASKIQLDVLVNNEKGLAF